MDNDIENWIKYGKGQESFDSNDFLTLFMNDDDRIFPRSDRDLDLIFQFFKEKEELKKNIKRLYTQEQTPTNVEQYILSEVKADIAEKRKIIEIEGDNETLKMLDNPIRLIENEEEFENILDQDDYNHQEYVGIIDDYFVDNFKQEYDIIFGLKEAFYGITQDYQMVWSLLKPLINVDVDLNHFFNLWKVGKNYYVTEKEILVPNY